MELLTKKGLDAILRSTQETRQDLTRIRAEVQTPLKYKKSHNRKGRPMAALLMLKFNQSNAPGGRSDTKGSQY